MKRIWMRPAAWLLALLLLLSGLTACSSEELQLLVDVVDEAITLAESIESTETPDGPSDTHEDTSEEPTVEVVDESADIPAASVEEPAAPIEEPDMLTDIPADTLAEPVEDAPADIPADTPVEPGVAYGADYSTPEEVALYLHLYRELPPNFLTKREAQDLGWDNREGNLWDVAPGKSIGGDYFGNREEILPDADYHECDVNYEGGYRDAERLVWSEDGAIYYTSDHYESFTQLYEGWAEP